jgi:hypothetical protein
MSSRASGAILIGTQSWARQSTPEELDYLAGGQLVHTRLPPR